MSDGLSLCVSSKMQPIRELIAKVAPTNTIVLLRGESGVGKEIVAHALHKGSPRVSRQFLKVNCAALPGELLESELFGHEKGAFTGAYRQKPGKFETAHQGTLFLDEIGEMPLRLQAKLLHVLQDGEFSRVGGERIIGTDVRLIAATNRDLESAMRARLFREDLFYRLNVIEIRIPPLRERREEVPVFVEHFRRRFASQYGRLVDIPPHTIRLFTDYSWPGNIRELENAVKKIIVLGNAASVHEEVLANFQRTDPAAAQRAPAGRTGSSTEGGTISLKDIARQAARDAERVAIKEVLDRVHWNRAKAARLLQISYKALLYKITQCGLVSHDDEEEAADSNKAVIAS